MFIVKDKNGQEIFLTDIVTVPDEPDLMGEITSYHSGTVIALPTEDTVQVQSLEGGIPLIYESDQVEVTDSLIQRVAGLANHEEFQRIIAEAEQRHAEAVASGKKPARRSSSGGSKRIPSAQQQQLIEDNTLDI